MRPLPTLCLLLSFPFLPLFATATDWQPFGPPGGTVRALVSDAGHQTHYAICSEQVYQSTDQGLSWNPLAPPSGYQTYADGVVVGSETPTLLVCLDTGGIHRWNAASQAWEIANNGLDDPGAYALQGFDLSIAESNATRVFFACSVGLYYSDSLGMLWNKVAYPNDSYLPTKVEAASDGSVYVYTYTPIRMEPNLIDSTFFVSNPGLPSRALKDAMIWPNPNDPMELLLTFPNQPQIGVTSVYYSSDAGENWTQPSGIPPDDAIRGLWFDGNPVILGATGTYNLDGSRTAWRQGFEFGRKTGWSLSELPGAGLYLRGSQDRGVWRTTDGGSTWDYSSEGMDSYGNVRAMAAHHSDGDTLYVAVSQSVWKTADDGMTWRELNKGLKADPAYGFSIRSLAIDPSDPLHLIAGSEVSGGQPASLYQSFDGGESWTPSESGPTSQTVKIHFVKGSPGVVLAGTLGEGVWRSTNNGTNWSSDPLFPQYSNVTDIVQEAGGRLFACQIATFNTQGGIFVSDNAGANWTFDESPGGFRYMAADPLVGGRVMGGYEAGGPNFTTDNGLTWNPANTGLPGYAGGYGAIEDLEAHPSQSGIYFIALNGYGIYRTANEGSEWGFLNPEEGDPLLRAPLVFSIREEGTLFAADHGVYQSKLSIPIVDLPDTPTPTLTNPPVVTPTPTGPSNPPTWYPGTRTPTPTPAEEANVGIVQGSLSISPKSPGTNGNVTVGCTVYNDSRANLTNIGIDCYWSKDGGPRNHFASASLPVLISNFQLEVPIAGTFTPSQSGTYTLTIEVDSQNTIAESNELDNERSTSVYVRAAGLDSTPPTGNIVVAGGNPFTPNFEVSLDFPASDVGSGVAFLWLEAFSFDGYSNSLIPYYSSGWVDYLPSARFFISSFWTGQIDAFAVNYADWDGNISETYWTAINYCQTTFNEFAFYDELIYYPAFLQVGQSVTLTLHNVYGDTDLFVIAPSDPPGFASWISQTDGIASENIGFTVTEEGVYWILVYGYDWSEYRLLCSGSPKGEVIQTTSSSLRKDRRSPTLGAPANGLAIARGIEVATLGVDFDGDGILTSLDLFYLAANWGMKEDDPGYDARCGGLALEDEVGTKHLLRWMSANKRR